MECGFMRKFVCIALCFIVLAATTCYVSAEESKPELVPMDSNEAHNTELHIYKIDMPDASWNALPRWRGVTLANMEELGFQSAEQPNYFSYEDMRDIDQLGFNFIRVPLDTRMLVSDGSVYTEKLENLDDLIRWGAEFEIHICLDVHSTFGMVTGSSENTIWENPEEQELFITFWDMLADRYAEIPNSLLSFNLMNEPHEVDEETYVALARRAIEAIRRHSSDRLIFTDMLDAGKTPIYSLVEDKVAQAIHMYEPRALTHWGIDDDLGGGYPVIMMKPMISDDESGLQEIVIEGNFPEGTKISFVLGDIHKNGTLYLNADGNDIFRRDYGFDAVGENGCDYIDEEGGPGEYRGYYVENTAILPADAQKLHLGIDGESMWAEINKIVIDTGEQTLVFEKNSIVPEGTNLHEVPNPHIVIDGEKIYDDHDVFFSVIDKDWIGAKLDEYSAFSRETGVAVMLQEFGVFYPASYELTCKYLQDLLGEVNRCNIPWCCWDFFGAFSFYAIPEYEMRNTDDYVPFSKGVIAERMLKIYQDN